VGQYVLAINFAYFSGGLLTSATYDAIGFLGVNLLTAAISAVALAYTALFSAPSLVVGKKPKPQGVWYALTSWPFIVHGTIAFSAGWGFQAAVVLSLWIVRDEFGWGAREAGVIWIVLPFCLVGLDKTIRLLAPRFGFNAIITTGILLGITFVSIAALPVIHNTLGTFLPCMVFFFAQIILQMLPNQSKPRVIAEGFATNATGAVTGAGRVCFALGQGVAPIVSALAYELHKSAAFLVWVGVLVIELVIIIISGQPLFRDVAPHAKEGSPAALLKAKLAAQKAASVADPNPGVTPATDSATADSDVNDESTTAAAAAVPGKPLGVAPASTPPSPSAPPSAKPSDARATSSV